MSQRILALRCRACGNTTPIAATHACDHCFGPLEVAYDYAEIGRRVSRTSIEAGGWVHGAGGRTKGRPAPGRRQELRSSAARTSPGATARTTAASP